MDQQDNRGASGEPGRESGSRRRRRRPRSEQKPEQTAKVQEQRTREPEKQESYSAPCGVCGEETILKYRPTGLIPIYCRKCFEAEMESRPYPMQDENGVYLPRPRRSEKRKLESYEPVKFTPASTTSLVEAKMDVAPRVVDTPDADTESEDEPKRNGRRRRRRRKPSNGEAQPQAQTPPQPAESASESGGEKKSRSRRRFRPRKPKPEQPGS